MKAMVLAAGLGTRLGEHTLNKPKALVEIGGKPLLAHILEKLQANGFQEVVINVHHFASQIISYLEANDFKMKILVSDETNKLMDTGGGILNAKSFLEGNEPFLVHNVDILSDVNLKKLIDYHNEEKPLATLAVGERKSSRYFIFDETMKLVGWKNNLTGKAVIPTPGIGILKNFAFAGIHVISPSIFNLIKTKGAFSIVDAYLSLCSNHLIVGYDTTNSFTLDVGKPQNLEKAEEYLKCVGYK